MCVFPSKSWWLPLTIKKLYILTLGSGSMIKVSQYQPSPPLPSSLKLQSVVKNLCLTSNRNWVATIIDLSVRVYMFFFRMKVAHSQSYRQLTATLLWTCSRYRSHKCTRISCSWFCFQVVFWSKIYGKHIQKMMKRKIWRVFCDKERFIDLV